MKKNFGIWCLFLFIFIMVTGCSSDSSNNEFISDYDSCLRNIESNDRINMTVKGQKTTDGQPMFFGYSIIAEDNPIFIEKSTKNKYRKEIIKESNGRLIQFFPDTENDLYNPIDLGKPEDFTLADLGIISGDHTTLGLKTSKIVKKTDEYYIEGSGKSILKEGALVSLYRSFGISHFTLKQLDFNISIAIEEDLLVFDINAIGRAVTGNTRMSFVIVLQKGAMSPIWNDTVSDFSIYQNIRLDEDVSVEQYDKKVKIELDEGQYAFTTDSELNSKNLKVYDRTRMISKNVHFVDKGDYLYNTFSVSRKGVYYFNFMNSVQFRIVKCETNFLDSYELVDNSENSGNLSNYGIIKFVINASERGLLRIDNLEKDEMNILISIENRLKEDTVDKIKYFPIRKGKNTLYIYSGEKISETQKKYAFKASVIYENLNFNYEELPEIKDAPTDVNYIAGFGIKNCHFKLEVTERTTYYFDSQIDYSISGCAFIIQIMPKDGDYTISSSGTNTWTLEPGKYIVIASSNLASISYGCPYYMIK